jgi:hypothetical protein
MHIKEELSVDSKCDGGTGIRLSNSTRFVFVLGVLLLGYDL